MIPLTVILSIAIIYALIRAKMDSYLRTGPWKTWAFVIGAVIAITTVSLVLFGFDMRWTNIFTLIPLFAFVFWLVFDCAVGYLFGGSILYLGSGKFDTIMKKTFKYNLPIFGWESGSFIFILVKLFCITFFTLSYLRP